MEGSRLVGHLSLLLGRRRGGCLAARRPAVLARWCGEKQQSDPALDFKFVFQINKFNFSPCQYNLAHTFTLNTVIAPTHTTLITVNSKVKHKQKISLCVIFSLLARKCYTRFCCQPKVHTANLTSMELANGAALKTFLHQRNCALQAGFSVTFWISHRGHTAAVSPLEIWTRHSSPVPETLPSAQQRKPGSFHHPRHSLANFKAKVILPTSHSAC